MPSKTVYNIDLKDIHSPEFLKDLSYKQLNDLSSEIRDYILHITSQNGGHLSSNLGTVESTIALCRCFDFSKDKIIFDVGHQCYTYKILTGRSLDILRKKGGVSGFQKRNESIYDCYEAGHSSTSISAANGFAVARDLNHENFDVIAFIGDASIVSGLAVEGLNNTAGSQHKIIVFLNDNGMSISKPTGAFGKLFSRISTAYGYNRFKKAYQRWMFKTKFGQKIYSASRHFKNWVKRKLVPVTIFEKMGFSYVGPIDGHNIKALEKAIKRAKNTTKSVVIHACTIKGKGYKKAENDSDGYWHGVTPFEIETGDPLNMHPGYNSWSHIYADITMGIMAERKDAYLIVPATIKGAGLDEVFAKYKNRSLDVGIAEEHALTFASALACGGIHPIISIYSTFMQRAYDEISHDLARMNCNSTILVDRSGLVGSDGETHQGIYDLAFLNSIPNVTVTMASTIEEANYLYEESFANHGPFFIRIPRTITKNEEAIETINIPYGSWLKIKEGTKDDLAIIGVGPYLRELADLIEEKQIDCTIYNALYLLPIKDENVTQLLKHKHLVIYDPYSIEDGFANPLITKLEKAHYQGEIEIHSIKKQFVSQATINEQLEGFELLPSQIVEKIAKN